MDRMRFIVVFRFELTRLIIQGSQYCLTFSARGQKLELSVAGVRLLLLGAATQLSGTVGPVVFLACNS